MRIGVVFPTKEFVPVEQMVERFVELETNGFSSGWLPQSLGFDALTLLAVVGSRVPRLELGTSVIPAFPRHPIVLGAQALTTNAVIGGRLLLGIGLSDKMLIEGSYGLPYDQPARRMRDYLSALVPLLHENTVDVTSETIRARIQLNTPGATPPSVLLAALQPRMLALAGGIADGTITWCTGPVTVEEQIVPLITAAAREAGKPAPRVCVALPTIVTDDDDYGRRMGDSQLEGYGNIPVYRAVLDREGVAGPGDVSVVGTEASVTAQLHHFEEIGATDFIAIPAGDADDRKRTLAHLATLV